MFELESLCLNENKNKNKYSTLHTQNKQTNIYMHFKGATKANIY